MYTLTGSCNKVGAVGSPVSGIWGGEWLLVLAANTLLAPAAAHAALPWFTPLPGRGKHHVGLPMPRPQHAQVCGAAADAELAR